MPNDWALRLMWFCLGAAALWAALRFRLVQQAARWFAMTIPFFGGIIHQLAVARFCHTFGLLTRAGVPYLEGLEATQPVVQHPVVSRAVSWIYSGVRNGNSLTDCIRDQTSFPAIVRNLVSAGEVSGSVDESLLKAGKFLREDAEHKIRNSAKFAGPVMIIILAVVVALIAAQFLQGYFKMIWDAVGE
jgi:type IV pilus assembly protein PilC